MQKFLALQRHKTVDLVGTDDAVDHHIGSESAEAGLSALFALSLLC